MNKKYMKSLLLLILFFTITFYSCEDKQNQIDKLSQSSNPEEYPKVEIKLGGKEYEVSLNYKINSQSRSEREFIDIKTEYLFKIGGLHDTTFYGPTFVKSDNSGNIYVLDMADCAVKKFSNKGVLIRKYGRRGRGPGEFMSPFRIDLTENGKLLVLDPNLNKCELFEGNNTKQFKLSSMPLGVCLVDSMYFATLQFLNPFDYSALTKHYIVNGSSEECQNLILINNNDVNLGPITFLQGDILSIDKNSFVYIPLFMNHFVKYSNKGKIVFAHNMIDNIKLPTIHKDNSKMTDFRLPEEYRSSLTAFVVDNKLYNVSYQAMKKKSTGIDYVIDVYSLSQGEYLYSFKLLDQEKMLNIYMDKNRLYLLKNNLQLEVLSYKIDE